MAHVRWHEEALGIGVDQHELAARRRLAPEHGALLLHERKNLGRYAERRLAPGLLLDRLRQREADFAEPGERARGHGTVYGMDGRMCGARRVRNLRTPRNGVVASRPILC